MRNTFVTALLLSTVFSAGQAAAATYTDYSAWSSAVTNPFTVNYEGAAPGADQTFDTLTGYVNGTTQIIGYLTPSTPYLHGVVAGPSTPWWDWGLGAILRAYDNYGTGSKITVTFSNAPTAVGAYLMTLNDQGLDVDILVNGTDHYTAQTFLRPTPSWWGITGSSPINTIEFSVPTFGGLLMTDYVTSATTGTAGTSGGGAPDTTVPETSSLFLAATGLIAVGAWRRSAMRAN